MSIDTSTIHDLPKLAASEITVRGWTTGTREADNGAVCLTGGLRAAATVPGDWHIAREVMNHRGRGEAWNDAADQDQVVAYLERHPIFDADLADTFGGRWVELVSLARRSAMLTVDEAKRLVAVRDPALHSTRAEARESVMSSIEDADRGAVWRHARDVVIDATRESLTEVARDGARDTAMTTAMDVARALVVRDLIGTHGVTQQHYGTLTVAWRQVIGEVHPSDV